MTVFVLAMTLYPEARKKAQAEIDAVVGDSRLPTFDDRDSLPYCNALAKEVVRWGTTAPLGMYHDHFVLYLFSRLNNTHDCVISRGPALRCRG